MEPWPNYRTIGASLVVLGGGTMLGIADPRWSAAIITLGLLILLFDTLSRWLPRYRLWVTGLAIIPSFLSVLYVTPMLFPIFDKSKVQVGLQYAYAWDNYKGSKNMPNGSPEDWWRTIDKPIEVEYSRAKYYEGDEGKGKKLVLGVDNLHRKLSIRTIRLDIIFQNDDLEITSEWPTWVKNKHFFTRLGNIVSGPPTYGRNLWVKFPGPGSYKITCKIYGDKFGEIIRDIEIILK
jgi:hypothetical protein